MDLALTTIIVAVLFSAVGIVAGFFLCKISCKKVKPTSSLSVEKEKIEGILEKINDAASDLKEKVLQIKEDKIDEIRKEIKNLLSEVEQLKTNVRNIDVSSDTIEVLDEISEVLKRIEIDVPNIDNSLLLKIKDNFLIVRNDLETILSKCKKLNETSKLDCLNLIDSLIEKLTPIISLSRKINATLVKDELTSLAYSIKGNVGSELVKDLDVQTLNSKELVLMLEEFKRKLEEVKNENSVRG